MEGAAARMEAKNAVNAFARMEAGRKTSTSKRLIVVGRPLTIERQNGDSQQDIHQNFTGEWACKHMLRTFHLDSNELLTACLLRAPKTTWCSVRSGEGLKSV